MSSPKLTLINRRLFLRRTAAAATVLGFPSIVRSQGGGGKLRLAIIGCGGRGGANMSEMLKEEIVALCDVNEKNLASAQNKAPLARTFRDFRKMYEELKDSEFDAVVVSTTEHTHAFATLPALKRKKHVYCEKPLTRDVRECRVITEAAKAAGVVTQMGTQNHANANFRRVVEIIQAGTIGPVRECHVWVSRAWGWQTQEEAKKNKDVHWVVMDRPKVGMTPPRALDWDVWLGPAPEGPFHEAYVPGPRWYRWWDFGNGTMSDLGSHWNDLAWWALKLDA